LREIWTDGQGDSYIQYTTLATEQKKIFQIGRKLTKKFNKIQIPLKKGFPLIGGHF